MIRVTRHCHIYAIFLRLFSPLRHQLRHIRFHAAILLYPPLFDAIHYAVMPYCCHDVTPVSLRRRFMPMLLFSCRQLITLADTTTYVIAAGATPSLRHKMPDMMPARYGAFDDARLLHTLRCFITPP